MTDQIKGMVIKREGDELLILTPEGDFYRIPAAGRSAAPGEEILFRPPRSFSRQSWLLGSLVAMMALLFLLAGLKVKPGPASLPQTVSQPPVVSKEPQQVAQAEPVAYLTVDINPSLELALDPDGRVLAAKALNADGEKLLAGSKLTGLTWEEALDRILERAASASYLPANRKNLIVTTVTVVKPEKLKIKVAEGQVKQVLAEKIKKKALRAEAVSLVADPITKAEADQQHVSVGKYLTWKRLKTKGKTIDLDDVKKHSIREIRDRLDKERAQTQKIDRESASKKRNEEKIQHKKEKTKKSKQSPVQR